MVANYKPRPEQARILDRAYEFVCSVSYRVTARWLFYALLQEGTYADKDSYKTHFLPLLAKARKSFYKEWRPDTLADDTREAISRGYGWENAEDWLTAVGKAKCTLDKWSNQSNYVELWFEAKAMRGQFEYYTKHITLRPFGGDPSIPYKWNIARELQAESDAYGLPIKIIYFGDLDPKGLSIPQSALQDIRTWCQVEFEFIRGGLNPGDQHKYQIQENPEKPGTYQWEALSDATAGSLIREILTQFVSEGSFSEIEALEGEITENFQFQWSEFIGGSRE